MKKVFAVIAVLALTLVSSMAMAEVTVSGSIDIRNLALSNTDTVPTDGKNVDRNRTTQERLRLSVDAKHEGVKGRITLENDWEKWGTETNTTTGATFSGAQTGFEARQGQSTGKTLGFREAWMDFTIPGAAPAHIKVGHQFLQLGNGWFFRSMKYGSDAWVVGLPGKNTVAFVDVKFAEGTDGASDDIDAYTLLDNFKIDDKSTVGGYFVRLRDPQGKFFAGGAMGAEANLDTIGIWYNGAAGPVNLQAEVDFQMGTVKTPGAANAKFSGNQIVLQANMPLGAASVNATIASGSGDDKADDKMKQVVTALDADPHYTFVYEYFSKTACGGKNTGFCNTQAINIGGSYNILKNLKLAANLWMLTANEKVSLNGAKASDELGNEIDVQLAWTLTDQLTWSWTYGKLMAGKAYDTATLSAEDVDAFQGILSYKF